MQYTVVLNEEPGGQWRAIVPLVPSCAAEAPTRNEALEQIKAKLIAAAPSFEIVQIEVPTNGAQNGQLKAGVEERWPGFGMFKDDPNWGEFFDELDRQRQ